MVIECLAALALLPWPQKVVETGALVPTNAPVKFMRDAALPAEGYRLDVGADGIAVTASDDAGEFYARRTLEQLKTPDGKAYAGAAIEDAPAYRWRGYMLDEGRHFFGKETVLMLIDRMADYKLNVFHWHLTEDQGWRLDVPALPELARYASVRLRSMKRGAKLHFNREKHEHYALDYTTEKYGPFFYTPEDVREIVAYAARRHVKVVPEIDLPGHMRAALAAYPHLACFPERIQPRAAHDTWGIVNDVLCVGNDESIRFLEKVMDYVCDVFPSDVIHIGGDECPTRNWKKCPKCQARLKELGTDNPEALQAYVTRRISAYLAKKGRRVVGWDEILAGDVPASAIGQSWRVGREGAGTTYVSAASGAAKGHEMVVTPHTLVYFSRPQGVKTEQFERRDCAPITLEQAYRFDPCAGVSEEHRARILGSEVCLWTEYVWNFSGLEWRSWPRTLALAEALWRAPAAPRDFGDFCRRADVHRRRLLALGVNCAPLE